MGFVIGLFAGIFLGVVVMACIVASKNNDEFDKEN